MLKSLFYGGSQTKSGRLSSKPVAKSQFKKLRRLESIVRLENAGFSEIAMAAMLTISVPRLRDIKKSSDYLNARIKITHGIILDNAGELSLIKDQRREILTQQLPAALQVLANELQRTPITLGERKHQTDVARDILDREGTFAKISRAEIKPVDLFDFEHADEASKGIIATIKGIAAPLTQEQITASITTNTEFSNSHTLSDVDQQEALDELERNFEAEALKLLPTAGEVQ